MDFGSTSWVILNEIYKEALNSYCCKAIINPETLAQKTMTKRTFIYNCAHYIKDKQLITGDLSYSDDASRELVIYITSKGIDIVERKLKGDSYFL